MSAAAEEFKAWQLLVERLLRSWTGFQLAIKMQSGGSNTAEKTQWFLEELAYFVFNQKDLFEDDLADWINKILFDEFDLILEDDSTDWVAESLLKCRRWYGTSEEQLNSFLSSLPSEAAVEAATSQSQLAETSYASDDDEEMREDDEEETPSSSQVHRVRQPRTVTDEEGWTTILPRK